MLPEVELRFSVPPESVKLPERVIVPEPPAVKVIVPPAATDELALTTMPPLFAVVKVKLPTFVALRLTPLFSLTKTEPVVEAERLVTSV